MDASSCRIIPERVRSGDVPDGVWVTDLSILSPGFEPPFYPTS